jgi:hypothetical protein
LAQCSHQLDIDPGTVGLAAKYAPDGQYLPRTLFLSPSGDLWADVRGPLDEYKYFYDEHDPKSVLAEIAERSLQGATKMRQTGFFSFLASARPAS